MLYLDAKTDTYLEEVSSCNIFVVKGNKITTPPLQVCTAAFSCSERLVAYCTVASALLAQLSYILARILHL